MKKRSLLTLSAGFALISTIASAQSQITVVNSPTGTGVNPTIIGTSNAANGSSRSEGVRGWGQSGSDNYGVVGRATGGTNYNVGVYGLSDNAGVTGVGVFGQAVNGVSSNYGVYGQASGGGAFDYAGYFDGDVFTTGSYLPSDERLKKDIRDAGSMLERLKKLRPVSYTYRAGELKYIHLPQNLQHGFVAQELEKVFPEAVKTIKHPVIANGSIERTEDITAVNYTALVPVLIKAVQEQQAMIDELKKQVSELSSRRLTKNAADIFLSPAIPNPSNTTTTIKYSIPPNVTRASIAVFDLTGNKVLQFNNLKGNAQVVVNSRNLQSGTYVYRLYVEGKETMSDKFVVGKG
jgi:hypothetical protein